MKYTLLQTLSEAGICPDRIIYFDSTDSTNTQGKLLAGQGCAHGTVLIANHQTGGRGRIGRIFHSPAGQGIYLTMILRPICQPAHLMHLTCAVGIAVCNAVQTVTRLRPSIKWINDLVFEQKKLGGILTELALDGSGRIDYAVVGIGLNCNQTENDFPEDIRSIATSLSQLVHTPIDRNALLAELILQLDDMTSRMLTDKPSIMEQYRKDCMTIGQFISLLSADTIRYGTALSVDDDGGLLVKFTDGHTETVNSGEVSVRGMYGYI